MGSAPAVTPHSARLDESRAGRSLDWLNFFIANLQTGFGPFIAVYLTTQSWTQVEIGVALSVGTLVTMLGQVPAGAVVDALPRKRIAASGALVAIAASAVLIALIPTKLPVMVAQGLHGFATCMLVPAIAALTLDHVGRGRYAERLGRNARFAALGNAAGAALMGVVGSTLSSGAVFWLAGALALPALLAVRALPPATRREDAPAPATSAGAVPVPPKRAPAVRILTNPPLLAFGLCIVLFHLANAAMLPLAGAEVTRRAGDNANLIIAACLVVPQGVVAILSPRIGRLAERNGRRILLLIAVAVLPIRGLLFATLGSPALIVAFQALDGLSGAAMGVLVPLVAADLAAGTGRFNLCIGAVGLAVGVGATLSTALAGAVASAYGSAMAFLVLTVAGAASVLVALAVMPETRPAYRGSN